MRRLQAMELFVSAVREGSFSAAGRRAGLSPAAVSRQIAALEASLGTQLLNRTSRSLALTEAGREYLARLEPILHDIAAAEAAAAALQATPPPIAPGAARQEATRSPGMNSLQQQARFDAFREEFNTERPHEALAMKRPAELYSASPRPYSGLPDLAYPLHDRDVLVTACGRICLHRKRVNISTVLAGQRLGIKEVDDGIWIVSFMRYDLGFIDLEQKTLQPLDNPFGPGLSPMS
jgi:molybdenum-dependent DNA-binding transcriptional regulator ModE